MTPLPGHAPKTQLVFPIGQSSSESGSSEFLSVRDRVSGSFVVGAAPWGALPAGAEKITM
jgi:hypothetical protein